MNTKSILTVIIILVIALGAGAYWYSSAQKEAMPETLETGEGTERVLLPEPTASKPGNAAKTETFSGELEEVNTGCFADGECYVVADGKHITTTIGWSQATVGTIQGVGSFGDLEGHIGEEVEVYAQKNTDGTYTLYGDESFYVKLK